MDKNTFCLLNNIALLESRLKDSEDKVLALVEDYEEKYNSNMQNDELKLVYKEIVDNLQELHYILREEE